MAVKVVCDQCGEQGEPATNSYSKAPWRRMSGLTMDGHFKTVDYCSESCQILGASTFDPEATPAPAPSAENEEPF